MKTVFDCYRKMIPEFSLFQGILQTPIPHHVRMNSLKCEPGSLVSSLMQKGVRLEKALQDNETLCFVPELDFPGNLLEYFLGYVHPQALTSCLVSLALSPKEEAYVLDMCAAPGGKTSHLAQLMDNTGLIVANELYPSRQVALGHTLSRLGVLNVIVTGYQAQEFPLRERFDYVLADVPCSGEGTFRIMEFKKEHRQNDATRVAKLIQTQKRIILRGFDLLKEGGRMLYSTCTYNPLENESVVQYLLENREARLLDIDVGVEHDPGIDLWEEEKYDKQLEKTARFYPHRVDSVGFFMARIGK